MNKSGMGPSIVIFCFALLAIVFSPRRFRAIYYRRRHRRARNRSVGAVVPGASASSRNLGTGALQLPRPTASDVIL